MTRSVGNEVPEVIRPLLAGTDIAAWEGVTFLLLTTADGGWPHLAMLSVGELVQTGPGTMRAALWSNSTATRNLTGAGQATIALVHAGAGYYLRCRSRRGPDLEVGGHGLAYFELQVEDALEDIAPYAELTSGVTFRLKQPSQVLPRWQATIDALRVAAPPAAETQAR